MSEYQLELKQIVDYPRCRIYRQFIKMLMQDENIRTGGNSGLYYFTVLSCYANFRTSYKRIDGISYTIYPGEWICRVSELTEWFRTRFQHQADRMYIKAVNPHLTAQITPGDTGMAGVIISNSEVGLGSVNVQPLIYRELNESGIIVSTAATKRIHRGRVYYAAEHFLLPTHENLSAADRNFLSELQDTVRQATDEEQFSQLVTLMQNAKEQLMNTDDIPAVVHTTSRAFGITDTEQSGVFTRLMESNDLSLYGLANAVTRHSQDIESYDRATDLEGIGYNILSMPLRQWTGINQAAA